MSDHEEVFHPEDAIAKSIHATTITGGAGLLLAAVQNTVARENIGAFGVFTRFGGTIALFGGMGGTYAFVSAASANLREKNDAFNQALGGFAAGTLVGLRNRSMPSVLGSGLLLGSALAVIGVAGGQMFGTTPNQDEEDTLTRKEEARSRFRRPINELINEIGEGRGIYGPGYDERRKQRIKDAYGIEIQEPYYKNQPATN